MVLLANSSGCSCPFFSRVDNASIPSNKIGKALYNEQLFNNPLILGVGMTDVLRYKGYVFHIVQQVFFLFKQGG